MNPYDWLGIVENNGYLHEHVPELAGGKVSVDHSSFTTAISIHEGRKATKKYKSVALLVPSPSENWFRGMSVGGFFRRV